jgi:hypothetical protein
LLVDKAGGPGVKPYQPAGLWKELSGAAYRPDEGDKLYRRSLYTYWKRTVAPPAMVAFDASDREVCTVRQTRTNTPLQALNLMNSDFAVEQSLFLAERAEQEAGAVTAEARVRRCFQLLLNREPDDQELEACVAAVRESGLPIVARTLINANEFAFLQ